MALRLKRVYAPPSSRDGRRYLVDRLWPRGFTREDLRLTEWLKDLAPSRELCTWFGHDPLRYPGFCRRYRVELERRSESLERFVREARSGTVTLLFAARDVQHSNASALRELLEERIRRPRGGSKANDGARSGSRRGSARGDRSESSPATVN